VKQAAADGRLVIGSLAAFLAFRLLEQRPCLVDPANASRTLLFDLTRGDWNGELLERFAIDPRWLPKIARSDAEFGDLIVPSRGVPSRGMLSKGALSKGMSSKDTRSLHLPLRLLSGDQSTAAFAYGELRAEAAYLNVGTGAFVYRLSEQAPAPSRLLRSVIHWSEAAQYVVEGTVNGAGSALAWFAGQHGISDAAATLDEHWVGDAPGDTLFLNGVGGLGSPDWRARFASRFIGDATKEQQLVAVAESIVFLIQRNLSLLQDIGEPCTYVLISGGLSRSDPFCQALSDLSGLPLRRPGQCEASARGSAFLLAGRPASWARLPEQRFEPQHSPALLARYRRWNDCMASAVLASLL
jgi:glycerol kinase